MSSTLRGILDLPAELQNHTFRFLVTADHRRLRLSCKQLHAIATALLLEDVRFTLSTGGVKRLEKKTDKYSGSIRRLTHVPLPVWPECPDYDSFCSRFCDKEREGIYAEGIDVNDPRAMKDYEDEQERRDNEHRQLFDQYQAEYEETQSQIQSLISNLYFLAQQHQSDQTMLQDFDNAIAKLRNLQEFIQETWSQGSNRWRHLHLDQCSNDDQDVESLHLFFVLRSLGLARLSALRYMKFTVQGPAFWTANRLGWLLEDGHHNRIRQRQHLEISVVDAEADLASEEAQEDENGIIAHEREILSRELDTVFNSVLHVAYLDCTVSEDESPDSLLSIAEPLHEFLGRARDLKRLRLTFGTLGEEDVPHPNFHCTDGQVKLLTLLAANQPWSSLQRLKIAMVIEEQALLEFLSSICSTLSRLTLHCVTLAPGKGAWESTLAKVAPMLPNIRLKLHYLCDYALTKVEGKPIVRVLYPEAAVWHRGDTSYSQ
jgi:hypothetical protein